MQHTLRVEQEALIIAFEGDVDLEHSPKAREVLLDGIKQGKAVFVDLSGVTYIGNAGVASHLEAGAPDKVWDGPRSPTLSCRRGSLGFRRCCCDWSWRAPRRRRVQ